MISGRPDVRQVFIPFWGRSSRAAGIRVEINDVNALGRGAALTESTSRKNTFSRLKRLISRRQIVIHLVIDHVLNLSELLATREGSGVVFVRLYY